MASLQTPPKKLISKKSTFWIAALSISAFLIGNMVGPEGFKGMFATVSSVGDLTFTGTVNPLPKVVDYQNWTTYSRDALMKQVPSNYLITQPEYNKKELEKAYRDKKWSHYSVPYMGDYKNGIAGNGSHLDVDITVPEGAEVVAIANAVVEEVRYSSGFGNMIILRMPNVPSFEDENKLVNYYPLYAHLSTTIVEEGQIVKKGEVIGYSGNTGFSTGPHLNFGIRKELPEALNGKYEYWSFSNGDLLDGMTFVDGVNSTLYQQQGYARSIDPMLYIQKYMNNSLDDTNLVAVADNQPLRRTSSSSSKSNQKTPDKKSPTPVKVDRQVILPVLQVRRVSLAMHLQKEQQVEKKNKVNVVTSNEKRDREVSAAVRPVEILIKHDGDYQWRKREQVTLQFLDEHGDRILNPAFDKFGLIATLGDIIVTDNVITTERVKNGEVTLDILPVSEGRNIVLQTIGIDGLSEPLMYTQ